MDFLHNLIRYNKQNELRQNRRSAYYGRINRESCFSSENKAAVLMKARWE